jgi:hypothetical protein
MKLLLSPAKSLDFESAPPIKKHTQPQFLDESAKLIKQMRQYSPEEISKLMHISDKLANLNYERFQNWQTPFTPANSKQCIYAFNGDVYDGLDAKTLSEKDIEFAQEHLRILSGLYGLLKPLDLMQPYRLEMGTKLKPSLYDFWKGKLTNELSDELIVNLASVEYFSAIKPKNILNIDFKESKNGELKIIGIFAKKARGQMARYIIQNQITTPAKIKKFNVSGYEFREDLSNDKHFIFTR